MIGINYRYQLNEKKGTIKLAPTKRMWAAIAVSYALAGVFAVAASKLPEPKPYHSPTRPLPENDED